MTKSRVIYATKTNHSKKIAEAIALELDLKAEDINGHPIMEDVDLLFIVGGIYGGESMPVLLEYVRGLTPSKVKSVALITNCLSGKQKQVSVHRILEENGIKVVGEYICRGALLFLFHGHPNSKDIKEAVDFAKMVHLS